MWSLGAWLPLHSGVFVEVGGIGVSAFAQISCREGEGRPEGKGRRGEEGREGEEKGEVGNEREGGRGWEECGG